MESVHLHINECHASAEPGLGLLANLREINLEVLEFLSVKW